jgi:triosephosphate isomerase
MLHIPYVKKNLRQDVAVAAQNVGKDSGYGAFTGEISADMLAEFGIPWVITGHSERRIGFGAPGESSALVAEKTKVAIGKGLNVMACVGEKLADREGGRTLEVVLKDQL